MNRSILALLIVVVIFSVTAHGRTPICPRRNEVWTECGSACPETCDKSKPQICTLQCVIGCQCRQGFIRNSKGICVPRHAC